MRMVKSNTSTIFGNEMPDEELVVPDGVTAETVLSDYIEAIGGKDRLEERK